MNQKEKEIINEEFLKRKDIYNLAVGGKGGDFKQATIVFQTLLKDEEYYKKWHTKMSSSNKRLEKRKKSSDSLQDYYKTHESVWKGKKHTKETKQKMSNSHKKIDKTGNKNPQFGKCWIIHPITREEKFISKEDLQNYLNIDFIKGRTLKVKSNKLTKDEIKKRKEKGYKKQSNLEKERKKKLGQKHCYINKNTGKRKFFRDIELSKIDLQIWKPTWVSFDVENIKNLLKNKYTWKQIAKEYDTTYWSIYSWYLKNKEKFKGA